MTVFTRAALGLVTGLSMPLLFAAMASGQGLPGPGSMSSGVAPAMPGAPIAPLGGAAPGAMGSMSSGMAPGMSQGVPSTMSQMATQGSASGAAAPAPPTAPMNGTTMTGGSATDGPVMTALHGTIYQTHKTVHATQGFITIQNQGAGPDTLTGITCPVAETTVLVDAGGTTLNNLSVAAGASIVLAPKGLHLQLQNIHFQVFRGSVVPCVLTFRTFGQIEVMLYAAKPPGY